MARIFTKVLENRLSKQAEKTFLKILLKEIQKIKSTSDLEEFLKKILTKDEKAFILRRLAILKLIKDKKKYRDIKEVLNVSGNTISAVKDIMLGYGYGKRNKTIKYSSWPKSKSGNKSFSKYPAFIGRGRWRFLNNS